ncbi:MAG: response regulator [Alphaproteobacteria bacterium]|nr:response regulator [Alphaproteobacteria bacterium]
MTDALLGRAQRWFDGMAEALVPATADEAETRGLRGAAVVLMQVGIFLVALWPAWAVLIPTALPAVIPLPPLVLTGVLVLRHGRARLALHLAAAVSFLHWTILSLLTGGASSPAALALALPPLFPALLRDLKGALAWVGAGAATVAAMMLAGDALAPTTPAAPGFGLVVSGAVVAVLVLTTLQTVADADRVRADLREANAELSGARDEARAASEAKSAFLAAMSHELRTPMNAVLGVAGLLAETELDPRQREYVETIRTSGNALVDLVEDILDFSRIEAGRLRIETAPFEPVAIVRQVADLLRVRAREKGLRLDVEVGSRVPGRLVGDGGRIRQILFNLVGNAVKYTDEGSVTVRVSCPGRNNVQARVLLEVVDTGIGIDQDDLARIFERFTQVGGGIEYRAGGTGLGLSITKHLVDLMGGRITVSSARGQGSTFAVELGLPTEATLVDVEDDELPPLPAARILLADDNPVNRKVALAMLDNLGCNGDSAGNGELAVRMVEAHPYDLVLMDCEMPLLDGYEATRRIRRKGVRIPIIAMTAHALPESRRRCEDAGMDDFLEKPVSLEELHRVLARWLVGPPA